MEQFEKSKALAVSPIQKRFDFSAQQLLRKVTQSGNLEAAMLLKSIIEDPEALAALPEEANSPQENELLKLLQQRDKSTAMALSPIEKRFELLAQPLIRKATQAGDQESAEKLQALFKKSASQPSLLTAKSSSLSSSSKTKESPEKDFEVTFQGETATITKYVGNSAEVRVPSKIQGVTVTEIGWRAFSNIKKIKEIVLPNTIKKLNQSSFFALEKLKNINIPASVSNIHNNPFFNCMGLETIEVDRSNEFYTTIDGVLYNKNLTTLITIPSALQTKKIKTPSTLRSISWYAVNYCQINTLEIPKDAEIPEKAIVNSNCRVVRY